MIPQRALVLVAGLVFSACVVPTTQIRRPELREATSFALLTVTFPCTVRQSSDRRDVIGDLNTAEREETTRHLLAERAPELADRNARQLKEGLGGTWLPTARVVEHPGYRALQEPPLYRRLQRQCAPSGMRVLGLQDTAAQAALARDLGVDAVVALVHDLSMHDDRHGSLTVRDTVRAHAVGRDGSVWWSVRAAYVHPVTATQPGEALANVFGLQSTSQLGDGLVAASTGAVMVALAAHPEHRTE